MSDPRVKYRPPNWPDKLLGWFCHEEHVEILRGDLYELYQERRQNGTKFWADLRFCLEVLDLFRPFALKKK
ncbi:MAG: permease prefix domain 2-containing transporter, partial [Cytophagales bacterium]|nr:permease prefix domain 2-containing transporter [Cytophagales bacterium]